VSFFNDGVELGGEFDRPETEDFARLGQQTQKEWVNLQLTSPTRP
jgi:hypothetical protein